MTDDEMIERHRSWAGIFRNTRDNRAAEVCEETATRIEQLRKALETADAKCDRAASEAMRNVCNDVMATVLASGTAEAKLDRICAKVEIIRSRASAAADEARAALIQSGER
jgi:hypothetical protein